MTAPGLDVRRGARERAGAREAVEERRDDLDQALAPELLVGVEGRPLVVREAVGHRRAQQALDARHEDDRGDVVHAVERRRRATLRERSAA